MKKRKEKNRREKKRTRVKKKGGERESEGREGELSDPDEGRLVKEMKGRQVIQGLNYSSSRK